MKVIPAPRGSFYIATYRGLTVFDEVRKNAISRLTKAIREQTGEPK